MSGTYKLKSKVKASSRGGLAKKNPVTEEDRERMLFWYTVYNGNYSQVAKKVSQETGINRTRKTVMDVAKRWNFATLSHVVRDEVNKRFYSNDTPGMGRVLKLMADVFDIDEDLILHAKRFMMGDRKAKVDSVKDVILVINHVTKDMKSVTGENDIKQAAMSKIQEKTQPGISLTMDQILEGMPEDEQKEVITEAVEQQINRILNHKSDQTAGNEEKQKALAKHMMANLDNILTT